MGAGSRPVAGRHEIPVKLHHCPVIFDILGQLHGLGDNILRTGNAEVILHITLRATILYAATTGLPASNSILDEVAEEDDANEACIEMCPSFESFCDELIFVKASVLSTNNITHATSSTNTNCCIPSFSEDPNDLQYLGNYTRTKEKVHRKKSSDFLRCFKGDDHSFRHVIVQMLQSF